MSNKRVSKEIKNKADIDYLCGLTRSDITSSTFMELFGEFNGKVKYNPYDIITVPAGTYGYGNTKNTKAFKTTVGKLIFNKIFIEPYPTIFKEIKWWGDIVTKKSYGKLTTKLGYLRLEDKVSLEDYKSYCNNTQIIMPYASVICPSYTDTMLTITKKITPMKEKLLKENKAAIENNDIYVVDKIQDELMDYARELMKDDPAMDMYNSGAFGDFTNNFKNMFIMKGAVNDPDPTKSYMIITSNYMDGVSADEYDKLANSLSEGPFKRNKKTETGGYWEKLFTYAFQHIKVLEAGTDCGTDRHIIVTLTDGNIADYMYSYIIEGSRLVEITSENKDKYIGKTVKLRFSSMCEAKDGVCSKCAGNLFYRLGFTNVGLLTPAIQSVLKNLNMKAFHDSQVRLKEMDVMKAFSINE